MTDVVVIMVIITPKNRAPRSLRHHSSVSTLADYRDSTLWAGMCRNAAVNQQSWGVRPCDVTWSKASREIHNRCHYVTPNRTRTANAAIFTTDLARCGPMGMPTKLPIWKRERQGYLEKIKILGSDPYLLPPVFFYPLLTSMICILCITHPHRLQWGSLEGFQDQYAVAGWVKDVKVWHLATKDLYVIMGYVIWIRPVVLFNKPFKSHNKKMSLIIFPAAIISICMLVCFPQFFLSKMRHDTIWDM